MSADSSQNGGTEAPAAVSTADIAAQVVESYEQPAESSQEPTTPPAETGGAPPQEPLSDEEQILHKHGFKSGAKPDGREHYLARSRVVKVIADAIKHGRDAWEPEKKTLSEELTQLRTFRDGFRNQLAGDERAFLEAVAQLDPRYRRFIEQQQAQAQAQAQREESVEDEPRPDLDLGNGMMTMSPKRLNEWLQWAIGKQLAPLHKEREEQKQREAQAQADREMAESVQQQLNEAQEWPNWKEYSDEILKKLQADTQSARAAGKRPRMTLKEAYLEVKADRLATGATHAREQAIADLRSAPKATGLRAGSEVPRASGPLSTADIARRVVERAERGGR